MCGLTLALQQGEGFRNDQREFSSNECVSSLHASVRENMLVWFSGIQNQGKKCHGRVEVHLGSRRSDVQVGGKPWKNPAAQSTAFILDMWNRGNHERKTLKWDVVKATRCRKDLHGSVLKENKCVRMIFCKATGEDVAVTKMWVLGKEGLKHFTELWAPYKNPFLGTARKMCVGEAQP